MVKVSMSSSSDYKRKKYLQVMPLEHAVHDYLQLFNKLHPLSEEFVDVSDSLRRAVSRPVYARISSPFYRASAMDGYAVRSKMLSDANETHPLRLKRDENAVPVDTGDPVPDGFDAVIMIEDVHELEDDTIEITKTAHPGQHIRETGEDILESDMLLHSGHIVRPQDMGYLLAGGQLKIHVRRQPMVTIVPTGSEVISPVGLDINKLRPGVVIDSNSFMLKAFVEQSGASVRITDIIPDDPALLEAGISKAIRESDLVLIIAGSSAGREDFTASILARLGTIFTHGLAIAPGKPTILSTVDGKPCLGMPGYPVSTLIVAEYVLKPLINQMLGVPNPDMVKRRAVISTSIPSKLGTEDFIRVGLGKIGNALIAVPYPQHAGSLSSHIRADGFTRIDRLSEGIPEHKEIEVELLVSEERLGKTIIHQGSHDFCLNIVQDMLWKNYGVWFSSFNIGSLGGLYALKMNTAHCAGCHILDPSTGVYNSPAIKEYLPGIPVKIIHLTYRDQGLIVAKGNQLKIKGIQDIAQKNVRFVNRQKGSGTRILLDYLLKDSGIPADKINGYSREEFTHLAVAVQIASGSADAGLGLLASARTIGLDFVPIIQEEYDIIVPETLYSDRNIQMLIETIRTSEFRSKLRELGGYNPSRSGEILPL